MESGKHQRLTPVVALAATLAACISSPPGADAPAARSEPDAAAVTTADIVEPLRSKRFAYQRDKPPASFYVALETKPSWKPNSRQQCVDASLLAMLRRLAGVSSAAHIVLTATIRADDGAELRFPLFVVAQRERGEPKCFSFVTDSTLTPLVRADQQTRFRVTLEAKTAHDADLRVAEQLAGLTAQAARFGGTAVWIVGGLGQDGLRQAAHDLDKALSHDWSSATADSYETELRVFADHAEDYAANGSFHDALQINFSKPSASARGVTLDARASATTAVQLRYVRSLFASADGRYPTDPTTIRNTKLGTSADHTLAALIDKGVNGVNSRALRLVKDRELMESYCTELKDFLGASLTADDALVARFSLIVEYSPYDAVKHLRSPKCFDAQDLARLRELGAGSPKFAFRELTRKNLARRDTEITELLSPVVIAVNKRNAQDVERLFADVRRAQLIVSEKVDLPSRPNGDAWEAYGRDVPKRLEELARVGALVVECGQAAPDANLTTVGAVLWIGGRPFGGAFHFAEDGRLEAIRVETLEQIRRFLGLPENWVDAGGRCAASNPPATT